MTYSPRTTRTMTTKKRSGRRGKRITRVIVHHWAGIHGGIERLVHSTDLVSANYILMSDRTLIGSVPEKYRAWTSGSHAADGNALTVECQNSTLGPTWKVTAGLIEELTLLIVDIARRYKWKRIRFGHEIRGHREFQATACPGPYLWPLLPAIAADANRRLQATKKKPAKPAPTSPALQRGSKGKHVKRLQARLNLWKTALPKLLSDGDYGWITERRVREWQRRNHGGAYPAWAVIDGIAGRVTLEALGL